MTTTVTIVVALGVGLSVIAGVARGFDPTSVTILVVMVALGVLAIAVTRKSAAGSVTPAVCPKCEGVISPNAPYCKHCGAQLR